MDKINLLKAIKFEKPEYIPMEFHINHACWNYYPREQLFDLMMEHKLLFPDFDRRNFKLPDLEPWMKSGNKYKDAWGCVWESSEDGIVGVVTEHPLASWDNFDSYKMPDSQTHQGMKAIDWSNIIGRL